MRYGPLAPRRLPKQDPTKVMFLADRWSRAAGAHAVWAERAKQCVDFFEGRQWTEKQRAELHAARRQALTFNIIRPLVRLVLGYQSNNRTDIVYRPSDDARSNIEVADLLSLHEKGNAGAHGLRFEDAEVFADGLVGGRGWYETLLDFEHNDLGEMVTRAEDPFAVYVDPDCDTYDVNRSASYLVKAKWFSIDEIEATYGKATADLLRPYVQGQTPTMPITGYTTPDEVSPIRGFANREDGVVHQWWDGFYALMGDFVDTRRKSMRVLNIQQKMRELRWVVVDVETGDKKVIPREWSEDKVRKVLYVAEKRGDPLTAYQRPVDIIQWTTICGDMILYDRESPYQSYSLTMYAPYFRRGIAQGMVEDLLDPQKEKNKRRSVEVDMVTKLANGGWMVPRNTLDPVQRRRLELFGSSPGLILEFDPEKGAPQQIQPGAPPIAHERLERKSEEDVRAIAGINESALGMDDRVQSGRAIQARQRQAVVGIQSYIDMFTRSKMLLGKKRLEIVQNHYTEERLIRVMGEDGKMLERVMNQQVTNPYTGAVVQVVNNITVGRYAVDVDEAPMSATFAGGQFEEMMEFVEMLAKTGAPIAPYADLIVDASTFSRKDDWKERSQMVLGMMGMPVGGEMQQPMTAGVDPATGQPLPPQQPAPAALPPPGA